LIDDLNFKILNNTKNETFLMIILNLISKIAMFICVFIWNWPQFPIVINYSIANKASQNAIKSIKPKGIDQSQPTDSEVDEESKCNHIGLAFLLISTYSEPSGVLTFIFLPFQVPSQLIKDQESGRSIVDQFPKPKII